LGMLALALTSIIGNVIPLATGVMTDILAGSSRPRLKVALTRKRSAADGSLGAFRFTLRTAVMPSGSTASS